MADIHIERKHSMGMAQARKAALEWAEQAEEKFGMECTYEQGDLCDEVGFKRSGVSGTLSVTEDLFELKAKLGFLLSAFKDKIEGEISKNLEALIEGKALPTKAALVASAKEAIIPKKA